MWFSYPLRRAQAQALNERLCRPVRRAALRFGDSSAIRKSLGRRFAGRPFSTYLTRRTDMPRRLLGPVLLSLFATSASAQVPSTAVEVPPRLKPGAEDRK